MSNVYRNAEGYYDPTAGEAVANADKKSIRRKRFIKKNGGGNGINKQIRSTGGRYHPAGGKRLQKSAEG